MPYLNSGAAVQAIWVPFDHESQNPVDQIRSHAQPDFRFGIRSGCDLAIVRWFNRVGPKRDLFHWPGVECVIRISMKRHLCLRNAKSICVKFVNETIAHYIDGEFHSSSIIADREWGYDKFFCVNFWLLLALLGPG